MILKGNQRAGARQMAMHLLNSSQNEHVTVHEVSGFMASDVLGALNEAYALSKGTRCKQFMYALSLNPPQNESVPESVFKNALERIEKKLNLEGQPRVLVFHEKEGRRHAHCVWSRIDAENMKAINLSHPKLKLMDIAKKLYLENNWELPDGFRDKSKKNPLNYTREEWQQALRIGRKPDAIKRELQECWAVSDSKQSFAHALEDQGYYLAQGRRGFVAVDVHNEVYSLTRYLGQKKKDLKARLGSYENLPSVDEVKTTIQGRLTKLFSKFSDELNLQHEKEFNPVEKLRRDMVKLHRDQRNHLLEMQKEKWQGEELKRSTRIRSGFKGLWDKINGRYWKNRKSNEQETWLSYKRDQKEREELFKKQMTVRQNLQTQINILRDKQGKERQFLTRDLSRGIKLDEPQKARSVKQERIKRAKKQQYNQNKGDFSDLDLDSGHEPEI